MAHMVSYKDNKVDLLDHQGKIIRRFVTKAKVVNAQVNEAGKDTTVAISMEDGHVVLYRSNGTVIRQS